VASIAAVLPLTAGIDALRQILFPAAADGLLPVWVELIVLGVLSLVFIVLARHVLELLERRARAEGRLTVRWL
jgi:ABC-2 type transport system permease protein